MRGQACDKAAIRLRQPLDQPAQAAATLGDGLGFVVETGRAVGAAALPDEGIDRYPLLAAAEMARKRLALLGLELGGKEKNRAVQLGSYEENIGLERGLRGPER